jgi:hypothetical protein
MAHGESAILHGTQDWTVKKGTEHAQIHPFLTAVFAVVCDRRIQRDGGRE